MEEVAWNISKVEFACKEEQLVLGRNNIEERLELGRNNTEKQLELGRTDTQEFEDS